MLNPDLGNILANEIGTEMEWDQSLSSPIVDESILNSQATNQQTFFPDIDRFLGRLSAEITHISSLLRQGDEAYAIELAHQMQYDSQAYGLTALSISWNQMVDSLQMGIGLDGADYVLLEVEHAYQRTLEALRFHKLNARI